MTCPPKDGTTLNVSPPIGRTHEEDRYKEEQIVVALKEIHAGATLQDVVRGLGVSERAYYRRKTKFGHMEVSDAKKLKGARGRQSPAEANGGRPGVARRAGWRGYDPSGWRAPRQRWHRWRPAK